MESVDVLPAASWAFTVTRLLPDARGIDALQDVVPVAGGQHRLEPGLQLGEQVVKAELGQDGAGLWIHRRVSRVARQTDVSLTVTCTDIPEPCVPGF